MASRKAFVPAVKPGCLALYSGISDAFACCFW